MTLALGVALGLVGLAAVVVGAELFAEHLAAASAGLGVSSFALALLLAGAEPEELATAVAASLRDAPAIALGDVIGANVAMCSVALGVGALVTPLPFGGRVRRYALGGLPLGVLAAWLGWDGRIGRGAGLLLVLAYVGFVATIWVLEREPPALGEVAELAEERPPAQARPGRDLALVLVGVAAMALGALALVEGVQRIAGAEDAQTEVALTIVGFATALELVVLAWSAARRGISEAVVAAVVGSFAYNATMTLGAGALARPLRIADASGLHLGWLAMNALLAVAVLLGARGRIRRGGGSVLLGCYPLFVAAVLVT